MVRIPLYRRGQIIIGYTLVDKTDSHYGEQKWYVDKHGYVYRYVLFGERYRQTWLHRQILGLDRGNPLVADHINGDKFDNRRCNLRAVTIAENAQNIVNVRSGPVSRYRGVTYSGFHKCWRARVQANGKSIHLGYFSDENEAGAVAMAARLRYLPFAVDR